MIAEATFACVLRTGGLYNPMWVYALKRGINRHVPGYEEFQFQLYTLTDAQCFGPWGIQLKHEWPKWWAKLELFRPGLFDGPVLYLDLDTLVVGDPRDLASYRGPLAVLSDLYRTTPAQSGVMAFTEGPATRAVWDEFTKDPVKNMRRFRGDGEFINAVVGKTADRLQDLYPRQIVSLKRDGKKAAPPGARLVCGHGNPRLSTPQAGWAHREWCRL